MKETKKSLKGYFIVVGILGILTSISPVITAADILTKVLSIVLVVLSGMFIFYGIKLYDYLQTSPKVIINFIIISLSAHALLGLLTRQSIMVSLILLPLGYIPLGWYLIHNVKKLSTQPK